MLDFYDVRTERGLTIGNPISPVKINEVHVRLSTDGVETEVRAKGKTQGLSSQVEEGTGEVIV